MYLQSIKSVKHNAAKSVNRSILKKSRHLGFGVFIVHSSMPGTELEQTAGGGEDFPKRRGVQKQTEKPIEEPQER